MPAGIYDHQIRRQWNKDERDAAAVLFHAGLSSREAARRFSERHRPMTRGAMIGLWFRMGLRRKEAAVPTIDDPPAAPRRIKRSTASGLAQRLASAARQRAACEEANTIPIISSLSDVECAKYACNLFELTNETCRWPNGDPGKPDFFFCGVPEAALDQQRPYCRGHTRIARSSS